MFLLGSRPSSGVLAGLAVLAAAGGLVAGSAVGFRGHPPSGRGTAVGTPAASPTPSGATSAGDGTAQPSPAGTAAPGSPSASPSPSGRPSQSPSAGATAASATASPAPPACAASDLVLTTATDRQTYQIGDPVRITTTMRNASSRACTTDGQTGCGPSFSVVDGGGATIWTSNPPGAVVNCPAVFAAVIGAGQSVSFSTSWAQCTWQNQKCTSQVQRGAYSAAGVWTEGTAGAARFSIA